MSNGVGATRPEKKNPQTTTQTRSEKREPQQAPMEQYTKVSNRRLERWALEAGVKMGIVMMVQRQTVGWQRMWWTTTVTDLATKIGRGRQATSKWLGKLVEAGEVVRRDLKDDKIMLALAEEAEEEGHVENSGGVSSVDDRGCRRSTTGGCRRSATPPPPKDPDCGGHEPIPKDREQQKEKNKKETLVITGVSGVGTVDKFSQGDRKGLRAKAKRSVALLAAVEQSRHCPSGKVAKLPGFPTRPHVEFGARLGLDRLNELWNEHVGQRTNQAQLMSYIWHSFESYDAQYVIEQLSRARYNLLGYANRVVRNCYGT